MKIYMLIPKTRELVKDALRDNKKVFTYSKGIVFSRMDSKSIKQFETYSYWGKLKKIVRHDEVKYYDSTVTRYRIESNTNKFIKENTVTRFNDGVKVLFGNWTMRLGKDVEKSKRYSAEYKTFEGEAKMRKQTEYVFRYV